MDRSSEHTGTVRRWYPVDFRDMPGLEGWLTGLASRQGLYFAQAKALRWVFLKRPPQPVHSKNDLAGEVVRGLGQLLDGVKQHFSLEKFDTGDILLVLIILFLYLEDGDNLELVITLGLLLLLGLGDGEKQEKTE